MKIKKLRFHSPSGSSIMTITSIDARSNDYGNKNTWVSSKDVWNNMTLADVDNLPKKIVMVYHNYRSMDLLLQEY